MATKDSADGGRRDTVAELEQLTLDTAIASARILPSQAQDELQHLIRYRPPAAPRSQAEGRPMSADELVVPAQQRGRREEQPPRRQSQA